MLKAATCCRAGADPEVRNDNHQRALSLAKAHGRDDLVQLIDRHPKRGKRRFGIV